LTRGSAILTARRVRGDLYNQWRQTGSRPLTAMTAQPYSVLSARSSSGKPLVQFRGL
jgi:hypothetical protein